MKALLLFLVVVVQLTATPAPAQDTASLGVMTFNLRYAHTTPPNLWPDRRPVVREVIERWRPDVVGTQEGLYHQLRDMEADLPAYQWIGLGRDGGSRGEFMAVFYRADRLEPLEYDHFWLSETPALIGSRTWGNMFPRMVTWVRFRDRGSGHEFIFANTHFDHQVQLSRERAAELLLDRSKRWGPELPVILVGDFNVPAGDNAVYQLLTTGGGFVDSWPAAGEPEGLGTFHDFKGRDAARGGARIDWILVRGPVATTTAEIITHSRNGQLPSDHFPVFARVRLH